jgi:hypothetical protein
MVLIKSTLGGGGGGSREPEASVGARVPRLLPGLAEAETSKVSKSPLEIRGRYYDHSFLRYSTIFCQKWRFCRKPMFLQK